MTDKNDKTKPIETNAETDKDELSRNRKTAKEVEKNPNIEKKAEHKSIKYRRDNPEDREKDDEGDGNAEDPTRFGDWTKNGRAIDF